MKQKPSCQVNDVEAEQSSSSVATEIKIDKLSDWRHYSSFNRIRKFIACCMIFKTKQNGPLKADEIHQAEKVFTLHRRRWDNLSERSTCVFETQLQGKTSITIDNRTSRCTNLLKRAHRDNLHEETEYVQVMPQQEHWIIRLRNALKKIKLRCVKCILINASPIHSPMPDLPRDRLEEHRFLFTHNRVDYFGAFEVKLLRRSLKRWCCQLICLTTRAAHIEVA